MRGKLRDKRSISQRDHLKQREVVERRRPGKHDNRSAWLNQQQDDEFEPDNDEEEESAEEEKSKEEKQDQKK
ncbi:MAG TPA: hypothetical protein VHZ51_20390 [Ktedonobacteraceae bacterium]|jgi:hypothetical protein|nr:hypothetical protein [Ktedonobacteraceae bacterium]